MSGSAKQQLIRLLSRRELSSAQALKKLLEREVQREEAQAAIAWCVEANYINDRRWAEGRVRALVRRKKSNLFIRQKLTQEGLSKELIEEALPPEEVQVEALHRLLAGRDLSAPKARQKAIQSLQRKGFPISLILSSPEISSIG